MNNLEEKLRKRIEKYLKSTGEVLRKIDLREDKALPVLRRAEEYYNDAKYYVESGDLITALAAICYAEGLLDALRLLELTCFQWP